MRHITGGKITTFKLGIPVFDCGITMVHVTLMFLSEWREFPSAPCLAGKKTLMTAHISMLLKSCASHDMLPFSPCNKKRLAISAHEQTPLSNDTINSILQHQEVSRAKDLSAPPRTTRQLPVYYLKLLHNCFLRYPFHLTIHCHPVMRQCVF